MKKELNAGTHIIYVSPVPDSKYITPSSNIIIRSDENLSETTIQNGLFDVVGSSSGKHEGRAILSDDRRTVLFQPEVPFSLGETVRVSLIHGFQSTNGDSVRLIPFTFIISKTNLNSDKKFLSKIGYGYTGVPASAKGVKSPAAAFSPLTGENRTLDDTTSLPPDFPVLTVTKSNNPSPGYIFINSNMDPSTQQYGNYLIIADNNGNPVFYRNTGEAPGWDFNLQPTGVFTYGYNNQGLHYIMDTSLQVIDSVTCGNGYVNDTHEMRILPNGNIFLLADDDENIDMSKIVPGGDPNATVAGNVVQELDQNRNVIFQWRTLDHLNITDAIGQDLTQPQVDPFHCNSIEIDSDGNILLSIRHFSAIIKIDVETGDILWQLGGLNNQFSFVNDPIGFSYQHSVRRLPNGDIIMFDNGNLRIPPYSRAVEYKLDEVDLTATLEWQYRNSPDIYGQAMGYVQRLPNGNTLIGWGYDEGGKPAVTEVTPDGSIALEMSMPYDVFSYRAYRYPFLFITSPTTDDTIQTGSAATIKWNSSGVDTVDIDYSTDGGNSWAYLAANYPADADSISFTVPGDSVKILQFRIIQSGTVDRGVTFLSDKIAVGGGVDTVTPVQNPYTYALSNNYPNPFNPSTTINYEVAAMAHVTLKVYNILGQQLATLVDAIKSPGEYSVKFDGNKFASGVYFYRLTTSSGFAQVKKMVLEK